MEMKIVISKPCPIKRVPHPELQKGELFIGNLALDDYFEEGWMTKRTGLTAYNQNGKAITTGGIFPVFIQEKEFTEAGGVVEE